MKHISLLLHTVVLIVLALASLACADRGPVTAPGVPVASVHVNPEETLLAPGATYQLAAEARAADGRVLEGRTVTWESTDSTRVRVDAQGLVTALRPGTVVVTARAEGKAGTARIVVPEPAPAEVAAVHVAPGAVEIVPAVEVTFEAVAVDAAGAPVTGRPVTWSVSDPALLTLLAPGRVRGLEPGVAQVSATVDGVVGSADVAIRWPAPFVDSIAPRTVVAGAEQLAMTLHGTGFTPQSTVRIGGVAVAAVWVSATKLRATVPAELLAEANVLPVMVANPAPGGGASNTLPLTVSAPPVVQYVHVDGGGYLWPGETAQLTARPVDAWNRPISGLPVVWESLNPAVATVDATGLVRVLTAGHAEIKATVGGVWNRTPVIGVSPPSFDVLYDDGHSIYRSTVGAQAQVRRLVQDGTDVAVSPDGTRMAFVRPSGPGGSSEIWVANIDGSAERRLSVGAVHDDQPAWSPDGARLAFRSRRSAFSDIWVMDADGGNARNLTDTTYRLGIPHAQHPAWSPDGTTIVYSMGDTGMHPARFALFTVAVDGGLPRLLAEGGVLDYPAYVRDGSAIVATSVSLTGSHTISWFNAATGERFVAPVIHTVAYSPALSPDGLWMVFATDPAPGVSELAVPVGMGWLKRLPRTPLIPGGEARNPVWVTR